ncbi:MAG: pentapeptide repeat-containing protein [Lachnospiraceae bacterium]
MKTVSREELRTILDSRGGSRLDMQNRRFIDMDLSGWDVSNIDFSHSDFQNVTLTGSNLCRSILHHTSFSPGCSLRGANLQDADISGAIFRYCDFSNTNMEGANLHCSTFEYANMNNIKANEKTRYYRMRCPETGAFLGYKRCFNDLLVQLLIPADAKRSSGTSDACRCDKAKVLTIKSFDMKKNVQEAWSVVDENFVYRVGEYVTVTDFNEDRWMESTTGIHFWMTREEAYSYLD